MSNDQNDADAFRRLYEQAVTASIWSEASIEEEPQVQLVQWSIRHDSAGGSYFVGARADDYTGRVSTKIVTFDSDTRRGRTTSGRVYELVGPPGISRDAEYVWEVYKRVNQIVEALPSALGESQ